MTLGADIYLSRRTKPDGWWWECWRGCCGPTGPWATAPKHRWSWYSNVMPKHSYQNQERLQRHSVLCSVQIDSGHTCWNASNKHQRDIHIQNLNYWNYLKLKVGLILTLRYITIATWRLPQLFFISFCEQFLGNAKAMKYVMKIKCACFQLLVHKGTAAEHNLGRMFWL